MREHAEFDAALTRLCVECALGRDVEKHYQVVMSLYLKAKNPLLMLSDDGSVKPITECAISHEMVASTTPGVMVCLRGCGYECRLEHEAQ